MLIHNLVATGSLSYNGVNISYVTGSQTSLDGLNQFSASVNTTTGSLSSSIAILSGSYLTMSGSYSSASGSLSTRVTTIESKYATTGSNIFTGAQTVCANITSTGTIIAQTLNVQQVTSSIVYSSGSNTFGCLTTDRQQFTGSVTMTGSLAVFTSGTSPEFQVVTGGTTKGNALTDVHQVTGSLRITGSNNVIFGSLGIGSVANETFGVTGPSGSVGMIRWTDGLTASGFIGVSGSIPFLHSNNNILALGTSTGNNFSSRLVVSGSNVGIGTVNPSQYQHGGTNTVLEVQNGASSANAQAHLMISTGATSNLGSIGSITFALPNTAGADKRAAMVQSLIESNSASTANGNLLFLTSCGGTLSERIRITSGGAVSFKGPYISMDGSGLLSPPSGNDYGLFPYSGVGLGINSVGAIGIWTNGAERMRITSGGQVGIRITPCSGWGSAMAALQVGTGAVISNWTGANANMNIGVNYYDNGAGSQLRLYAAGVSTIGFSEDVITFNNAASSTAGSSITFCERMRITSTGIACFACPITAFGMNLPNASGNVLQFGTTNGGVITISDTTNQSTGIYINSQTFNNRFMKFFYQGNAMGEIYYNGSNTSYAASGSDIKLKKNIVPWAENVLALFRDINPKLFNWNFESDTAPKSKGFIAQEMACKFPEAYHLGTDGLYLYNPSGMVVYLMKAIQEQQCKINILESCLGIN